MDSSEHAYFESQSFTHTFTLSQIFNTFDTLFKHSWLFSPFFSQSQQVGCLKVGISAGKLLRDTFAHFHTLLHILSLNLHIILTHFRSFLSSSVQFQHVRCITACTQDGDLIGDNLTQLHPLLQALSYSLNLLFKHYGLF